MSTQPDPGALENWIPALALTENLGEPVARKSDLWETVTATTDGQSRDFPEAGQPLELYRGCDWLAAEIESGRRILPGLGPGMRPVSTPRRIRHIGPPRL